jgi:hypothetical protein
VKGDGGPLRRVVGLHDGLSDGAVLAFDDSVGARIVKRDAIVSDAVLES